MIAAIPAFVWILLQVLGITESIGMVSGNKEGSNQMLLIETCPADIKYIHLNFICSPTHNKILLLSHFDILMLKLSCFVRPSHHRIAHPQVADGGEDSFHIWRVAVNILNKQFRTVDNGRSSILVVGRGAKTLRRKNSFLRNVTQGLGL